MSNNPIGRPTKFKPEFVEQVYKLSLLGLIDTEMAEFFEVCEATFHNWKLENPDFLESLTAGKLKADAEVALGLYERAKGTEIIEEQAIKVKIGPNEEAVQIVNLKKQIPADTRAAFIWLQNRQSSRWKDRREEKTSTDDMADAINKLVDKLPS